MKKTILPALPAVTLVKAGLLLFPFFLSAQQVTVQDDAKVGLIVTGTGHVINTTQIFGKSPEYAELKKRLDGLQAAIAKKADDCEQMAKDSLPQKYRDNCRAELIALNAERDSVQKIETRFREDVIRLAETFSKMELNSERLRLAKQFFDDGKIREADNVLNAKEMKQEGDVLLAEKAREQDNLRRTDSLLRIKADEFTLKARLKATDYSDFLRYDTAVMYFEQSRRYAETVDNLQGFAYLLSKDNQTQLAINYFEKALELVRSESEEATLAGNLGVLYSLVQKIAQSEKMYLRSLEIYERLAKSNPAQFEPNLAKTCMHLGNFYSDVQKMAESENLYLYALDIQERLAKSNPAQFETDLAKTCMNLGLYYHTIQKMMEAEKMYLHALDIQERLVKSNPLQFEPDLALTCMHLGNFYSDVQKMAESEKMYLRSLEIRGRLVKLNPAQFEPDLASTCMGLGNYYQTNQKMTEAENMYLRSLEIYERLAKSNPAQFEPDLVGNCLNLGVFYYTIQKMEESGKMYLRSLEINERLAKSNPPQFEPYLALNCRNLGIYYQTIQKIEEAGKMYLRSLEIYERLAKSNPAQFEPSLAEVRGNMSWFYLFIAKFSQAQTSAERVLAFDPTQNWARVNLGHSYLLRGDWDKAKAVYEEYLKNESDPAQAKATLLQDWDDLEKAGVTHKDMAKARKWARA